MHENIRTIGAWQAREVARRPVRERPPAGTLSVPGSQALHRDPHPISPLPKSERTPESAAHFEARYRRQLEDFIQRGEDLAHGLETAGLHHGTEANNLSWEERSRLGENLAAAYQPTLPERYQAASNLMQGVIALLSDNLDGTGFLAEHPEYLVEKVRSALGVYGISVVHDPDEYSTARIERNRLMKLRRRYREAPDR